MPPLSEIHKNLEDALQGMKIPPRPEILNRILLEMRREDIDYRALARMIGADISLAASLIKTVNSSFFGIRTKATSVHDALLLLGLEVATRMIAGILLRRAFPPHPELEAYWDESIKVAMTSHVLAHALAGGNHHRAGGNHHRADDAYTFGLFRDCGMVMMMLNFPDYGATVARANEEGELAFTAVEIATHGIDHTVVGSRLAEEWLLPSDMVAAIRLHHALGGDSVELDDLSPAGGRLIALAQLAEKHLQAHGLLPDNREWDKLGAACLRELACESEEAGMSEDAWNALREQLREFEF